MNERNVSHAAKPMKPKVGFVQPSILKRYSSDEEEEDD
jgi:hypothetical protein